MNTEINLGPIKPLFNDDSISEVMINSFRRIFVEKDGQILVTNIKFHDEETLQNLILQMAESCGREINAQRPFFDGYLPDGSRINAVIPPMSPGGANVTIRKFRKNPFSLQSLVQKGSVSDKCAFFLEACIKARLNIIVSGGTGTGKTTFLNVLSSLIPPEERVITIEDTAELQLQHPNWVRLESVHLIGQPGVTIRDCLVNSLRMRPDRIIVGECRRDETFEMLQAMNTGHDGSMTTIHANSPRDCLSRIESLIISSNVDYPLGALRKQIVSAVDLVVQLKRIPNGGRHVSEILELTGLEQDTITAQPVFSRDHSKILGKHKGATTGSSAASAGASGNSPSPANQNDLLPTGLAPTFLDKFTALGIKMPPNFFDPNSQLISK